MTAHSLTSAASGAPAASISREDPSAKHLDVYVSLSRLAPFHASALKLMNISVEGDSAFADFEEAFKCDPALTADLLLVANSCEFGLRARIETIRHALTFLGLERVRSLGCTIAFSFYVRNVPRTPYMTSVWEHSLATAVLADFMGKLCRQPSVYTAGLTHDLGRLALFLSLGSDYAAHMAKPFESEEEADVVELAEFGIEHTEAGARVAAQWGFPETLRTVMLEHHHEISGNPRDPLNLVRAACRMASSLGFREVEAPAPAYDEVLPEIFRRNADFEPDALREQVKQRIGAMKLTK
ncbi:MAG: HDOD domain-containing protein [Bryobacteraceae bacterium]